ncbi:MAG: hypothetical protein HY719_07830 [Planctomycetes bacterium]|nr:hypothetical protein [Planctomycetota bacterium]
MTTFQTITENNLTGEVDAMMNTRHPEQPLRVLILSASAGNGHTSAARAIEQAFARRGKEAVVTSHLDMLDLVPWLVRFVARDAYVFMIDHTPRLWGRFYYAQDRRSTLASGGRGMRRVANREVAERLFDAVEEFHPDLIVSTHFLLHMMLRGNEGRLPEGCRLALVVTDNDAHRCWQYEEVDQYYVYSDEVLEAFTARGVARGKLLASGMPVEEKFFRPVDRKAAYARFGFDPARRTVALIKGMARWGWLFQPAARERLLEATRDANVLIVVGRKDEKLYDVLKPYEARHPRLRVEKFVSNVEEVLAIADLVVGKAGGAFTAELIACKTPAVLMGTIPGQEEKNRDLLVTGGVAREATEFHELVNAITSLLRHPEDLDAMRRRYDAIWRRDPAEIIVRREMAVWQRRRATRPQRVAASFR